MNKYIDIRVKYILFGLLLLYNLRDIVYPSASLLSKSAIIGFVALSGVYFIKCMPYILSKNSFLKYWAWFFLLNFFGYIFTSHLISYDFTSRVSGILISSLSLFPFWFLSHRGIVNKKDLIIFFLIIMPVFCIRFIITKESLLEQRSQAEDVVTNAAYLFVYVFPFVFLIRRRWILSYTAVLVLLYFIIQGAKRGAIITGIFIAIVFGYYQIKELFKTKNKIGGLAMILGIIGLGITVYNFYISNQYMIARMEKISEGGSGRDIIYTNLFNAWYNSENIINILFGYGFSASLKLSGTGHFAHNDWLELLTNYGLAGVILYFILFFQCIKYIKNKNISMDKREIMVPIILIWITTSLVSMNYMSGSGYLKGILLGYLFGSETQNLRRNETAFTG